MEIYKSRETTVNMRKEYINVKYADRSGNSVEVFAIRKEEIASKYSMRRKLIFSKW